MREVIVNMQSKWHRPSPLSHETPGREPKYRKTQWFLSTFVVGHAMIARQPQMLQMSAVDKGQMSSVETGQMSAVETGQMAAAETGQMSAVDTRRMSTCLLYTSPSPRDRG